MTLDKNSSVLVVSHYLIYSEMGLPPMEHINNNLKAAVKKLVVIESPLPEASENAVHITKYISGKLAGHKKINLNLAPSFLGLPAHAIINPLMALDFSRYYDLCIACDNLSLVSMIPLRRLGKIKKLVYYSIDYTPKRFNNKIANRLYHFLDEIAWNASDKNWVLSESTFAIRNKLNKKIKKFNKTFVVPVGFKVRDIRKNKPTKVDRFRLIYVGGLIKKQGLQMVLKAFPEALKIFPKLSLTIIGSGEYSAHLKRLVRALGLQNKVKFRGFIKNHKTVEKAVVNAGVGLAPYEPSEYSFTRYTDPGKIKLYLACGIPTITTSLPSNISMITKTRSGEIMNYSTKGFTETLKKIIWKKEKYQNYRDNASKLGLKFDIDEVLKEALEKT